MRVNLNLIWVVAAVAAGPAVAADFLYGVELKKTEEEVRARTQQATQPLEPPKVTLPQDRDELDVLDAVRGIDRSTPPLPTVSAPSLPPQMERPAVDKGRLPAATTALPAASKSLVERASGYVHTAPAPMASEENDDEASVFRGNPVIEKSRGKWEENLNRAKSYSSRPADPLASTQQTGAVASNRASRLSAGMDDELDLSHVGKDGIPVVPCVAIGSTAGRVGDDSLSGQLVEIYRKNKPITIRCQ